METNTPLACHFIFFNTLAFVSAGNTSTGLVKHSNIETSVSIDRSTSTSTSTSTTSTTTTAKDSIQWRTSTFKVSLVASDAPSYEQYRRIITCIIITCIITTCINPCILTLIEANGPRPRVAALVAQPINTRVPPLIVGHRWFRTRGPWPWCRPIKNKNKSFKHSKKSTLQEGVPQKNNFQELVFMSCQWGPLETTSWETKRMKKKKTLTVPNSPVEVKTST